MSDTKAIQPSKHFPTREAYRAAWDLADKVDAVVPLNVDIELASVCNLECPFCFISDKTYDAMIKQDAGDGKQRRRLMPTELALRIIDQCADIGVPAIKMNWRGESTLHHDYAPIIRYAASKSAFFDILVNTNANCNEWAIDGLMAATKVMVSLDSMVPETYRIMRRGGSLTKAKDVIHELIKRGHPNVWVRRVLTRENKHEPFFQAVREAFGDKVHVSEHYCFDRNAEAHHETVVGCDHDEGMARRYCGYPSQRLVVTSSGLVVPCCIALDESLIVGDLKSQSLLDVWRGPALRDLRTLLRSNNLVGAPSACRGCQSWMAYDRPERKFVQDVAVVK